LKGKALFIINPISGGKKKDGVPGLIDAYLDKTALDPVVLFSDSVEHARQLTKEGTGKFDVIVAVGGDGTVNEVASAIVGTDTPLGIIPFGSGNGLSRFLQIPMEPEKALKTLISGRVENTLPRFFRTIKSAVLCRILNPRSRNFLNTKNRFTRCRLTASRTNGRLLW
jgi:diacylglycerol kinase (ATP)